MKKTFICIAIVLVCVGLLFSGCHNTMIDYGQSDIYTQADMDAAIRLIEHEFSNWHGCRLYSISYTSDDICTDELEYCNSLFDHAGFTQCIVFRTSFRSPVFGGGAWNANHIYDWSWYLARTADGAWQLLTWGAP